MDTVIDLVHEVYETNDYGVDVLTTHDTREVFARVEGITRAEFAAAGRNGLNPQYKFVVFSGDYEGERTVGYDGEVYAIYRTYQPTESDYMELYAERQGGTNGQKDTR